MAKKNQLNCEPPGYLTVVAASVQCEANQQYVTHFIYSYTISRWTGTGTAEGHP